MSIYRIQGAQEKRKGIFYEFDSSEEPLGRGGMGVVYKGRCVDTTSGMTRVVAVKFLYEDFPEKNKAAIIERARREAAVQIRHDNLVEMLGFIETESVDVLGEVKKHYHIVSELLEGVMLDDLLEGKVTDKAGNVIPFAQKLYNDYQKDHYHFAIYIVRNILSGLMALHDAGYIHRDIDPTNIMVTKEGHVKLIDFGIAKKMDHLTDHDKALTVAGVFMGKPEYASPELVLGAINEQNQTTDIYAMGILLFQCIVGHVPFEGDRSDIMRKQLHEKLPLSLIKNSSLRKIIGKATEKSRSKRYQSSAEFRVALDNLPQPLTDEKNLKPVLWISAAICALIAVVAVILNLNSNDGEEDPNVKVLIQEETRQTETTTATTNYADVVVKLKSGEKQAWKQLYELSDAGDWRATYLLSRIFFEGKRKQDLAPDSVLSIKSNLCIDSDNQKAHDLLEKTVSQKSNCYQALYELGCDYFGADKRADGYVRDLGKAKECFDAALKAAQQAHDLEYENQIQKMKNNLDRVY